MTARGELEDTYAAALQHELVAVPSDATLLGVVRRPTRWLSAVVDKNVADLGPPDDLLTAFQRRRDDLKMRGLCEEGAHNAAWDEVDFSGRYREYLETSAAARDALRDVADRVEAGESVVLVCYENTSKKRCHRTTLRRRLAELM
ncbi:MAG: DUF488 family protein [Halobacteriota archaeon]